VRGRPAAASRSTRSARTAGARDSGSFWSPSLGPTSQTITRTWSDYGRSRSRKIAMGAVQTDGRDKPARPEGRRRKHALGPSLGPDVAAGDPRHAVTVA